MKTWLGNIYGILAYPRRQSLATYDYLKSNTIKNSIFYLQQSHFKHSISKCNQWLPIWIMLIQSLSVIIESSGIIGLFSCSVVWTTACQASLSFTISRSLLKFMSIGSVMPLNHLALCHPPLHLPPMFPSF